MRQRPGKWEDLRDKMRVIYRRMASLAAVLAILLTAGQSRAEGIRWEELKIPAVLPGVFGTSTEMLEAVVMRPDDGARHPLALVNHGSPRNAGDRPAMSALGMWPQMREFARRGWTAVAFLRRGYGRSEGGWAEDYASCDSPRYENAGRKAAEDLAAVAKFMAAQPYVAEGRWISVGVSAGAYATVALTAAPPPGLAAAIAFAPGRGSQSPDYVCGESRLVAAFAEFGKTSRIPLLWVSAENDHFFGPRLVKQLVGAFSAGGAPVTFIAAPSFGEDGHHLFSARGTPIWAPMVDGFLKTRNLAPRDEPFEISRPEVATPAGLNRGGQAAFPAYLDGAPNKAFATGPGGHSGWASGRRTEDEARTAALAFCARQVSAGCAVVNVNDKPIR